MREFVEIYRTRDLFFEAKRQKALFITPIDLFMLDSEQKGCSHEAFTKPEALDVVFEYA